MKPNTATPSVGDLTSELGTWMVGGAILTMMLFPVALPILLLTAAAVVPLLAPLLLLIVVLPPALMARAATRAVRRSRARRQRGRAFGR